MNLEIAELSRRIENIIRTGTIAEADYDKALVRVKYDIDEDGKDVITDWRPWLTRRASNDTTWHAPEVGEQVLLLSPSGDVALAMVLPALYQVAHTNPSTDVNKVLLKTNDGAEFEYDRATSHLQVTLPGIGTTEVISPLGTHISGNLSVTGDINSTGNVSDATRSMAADRGIYNGHKHKENDVGGMTDETPEQQ